MMSTLVQQRENLPLLLSNKVSETDNGSSLMHNEDERLLTFTNWQVPFISKKSLAKDGFYYTGNADVVRCAFCLVEIGCWEDGDVPNSEHKRWSPNCPMLKGRVHAHSQSGNSLVGLPSVDTCGYAEQRPSQLAAARASLLSDLGVEPQVGMSFPKYSSVEKRLESFKNWPISLKQKPNDLANAGFYYTGVGDQTICFSCGIGLKDWQEEDGVWEEHALWSPKCTYLRLKKDAEFIASLRQKNQAVLNNSTTDVEYNKACSSLNINIPVATSATNEDCKEEKPVVVPASSEKPKEKSKEDETLLCGICYNNERSILYLPCRHMIACVDCGANERKCPVCRKEVKAFVKAYLS